MTMQSKKLYENCYTQCASEANEPRDNCKHGIKCYKIGCKYHHPHPENPNFDWRLCEHGPACYCYKHGKCLFRHLIYGQPVIVQVHLDQLRRRNETAPVNVRTKVPKPKPEPLPKTGLPCPDDLSCPDPNCPHHHPPSSESDYDWRCCKHNGKCTKEDCIFRHLNEDGTVVYRQWQLENLWFLYDVKHKITECEPKDDAPEEKEEEEKKEEKKEVNYEEEFPPL